MNKVTSDKGIIINSYNSNNTNIYKLVFIPVIVEYYLQYLIYSFQLPEY